jgi:hypothetical protein
MSTEHDSFWTGCRLHFFVVSLKIEMIGTFVLGSAQIYIGLGISCKVYCKIMIVNIAVSGT